MFKLNFHRQAAPATEIAAPAEIIVREDFTMFNVDDLTVTEILQTLRADTILFTEQNNLTWAATDFVIRGTPVRVKLTLNQDIVYTVDGTPTFDMREAVSLIKAQAVTF